MDTKYDLSRPLEAASEKPTQVLGKKNIGFVPPTDIEMQTLSAKGQSVQDLGEYP